MNRREAISSALAVPFAFPEMTEELNLKEGTVVAAIRFNGKTYALGMKLIPDDPTRTAKYIKYLMKTFETTIKYLLEGRADLLKSRKET